MRTVTAAGEPQAGAVAVAVLPTPAVTPTAPPTWSACETQGVGLAVGPQA